MFTCAPGFFAIVRWSRTEPYDIWPFLSLVLAAVMEAGLSWSLVLEASTSKKALFSGASLGFCLPIAGAYLLQNAMAGMDTWSLVPGALLLSIPSAAGGALAARIQWRSKEAGAATLAGRFLISTLVWAVFSCGPAMVVMRKVGPFSDYLWLWLLLLFGSTVEAGLLWSLAIQTRNPATAIVSGAVLGFVLPSVWGFLLAKDVGAFDAQPLIVAGLDLGVTGGIGGALAGWIQFHSRVNMRSKSL